MSGVIEPMKDERDYMDYCCDPEEKLHIGAFSVEQWDDEYWEYRLDKKLKPLD